MSASPTLDGPLKPGATIGILGGGQLGRMLALAAARLGLKTHIYSDETESCAMLVASAATRGHYDDETALETFAKQCDVVTFEFENVPSLAIDAIEEVVPVRPSGAALHVAQQITDDVVRQLEAARFGMPPQRRDFLDFVQTMHLIYEPRREARFEIRPQLKLRGRRWSASIWPSAMQTRASCAVNSSALRNCTGWVAATGSFRSEANCKVCCTQSSIAAAEANCGSRCTSR